MAENNTLEDDDLETSMDDEVEEGQEALDEAEDTEFVPLSKEETSKIRAALEKANNEAKKYRLEVKNLKAATKTTPEDEDEKVSAAKKEVEEFYRPRLVRSAVKSALKDAGLKGAPDRLLKLIDVADFEIDDNGEVNESDLESAIGTLKSDYPELFVASRAPRIDAGREATGQKASKDSAEVLLDRIRNPRGR